MKKHVSPLLTLGDSHMMYLCLGCPMHSAAANRLQGGNHKAVTELFYRQCCEVCDKCFTMQWANPGESQRGLDGRRVLEEGLRGISGMLGGTAVATSP